MSRARVLRDGEGDGPPKEKGEPKKEKEGLRALDIFCYCTPPRFELCNMVCGACTLCCGVGLDWCCCYGCDRKDCAQVFLGGLLVQLSSLCVYGVCAGCVLGLKIMGFFL